MSRRRQYSLNPRNAHGLSPASVTRQSDEVAWTDEERERYWAEMQRLQAERPHADPEPE